MIPEALNTSPVSIDHGPGLAAVVFKAGIHAGPAGEADRGRQGVHVALPGGAVFSATANMVAPFPAKASA